MGGEAEEDRAALMQQFDRHSALLTQLRPAERALGELEKLRQQHLGDYPSARCLVRSGVADAEIVNTAKDEHADLIVIGTHGRGAFVLDIEPPPSVGSVVRVLTRANIYWLGGRAHRPHPSPDGPAARAAAGGRYA